MIFRSHEQVARISPPMNEQNRSFVGLAGVITLAMATEFNDQVAGQTLRDISGGLGLERDAARWFEAIYVSAQVVGMSLSPWIGVTITIRRFTMIVAVLGMLTASLIPLTSNLALLYILRFFEGLSGGFAVPLLMTTALRVLAPPVRPYGLAAYALTATFFPNLSTAFAGLWTDLLDWRFVFWQSIPFCTLALVLLWFGMPRDPLRLERFRQADWRGALLVIFGMGSVATLMQLGDWLDWFNSPFICVLALLSVVCIPLFILNEWNHPLPLFKLQLLGRRNFAYGACALLIFVVVSVSSSSLPAAFLTQVAGYRPEQIYPITLLIAAQQLVMLPLMAVLLNRTWVDSRILSLIGMICTLVACIGCSFVTSEWTRHEFYLWQSLQGLGEAMIVMPLLLMATNALVPAEGPFASALVNTPRAVAEAFGIWLVQLIERRRGTLHADRLADHIGATRYSLYQAQTPAVQYPQNFPAPLTPSGLPRIAGAGGAFQAQYAKQALVLTLSDAFMVMAGIVTALMILLLILPQRTFPPRLVFIKK